MSRPSRHSDQANPLVIFDSSEGESPSRRSKMSSWRARLSTSMPSIWSCDHCKLTLGCMDELRDHVEAKHLKHMPGLSEMVRSAGKVEPWHRLMIESLICQDTLGFLEQLWGEVEDMSEHLLYMVDVTHEKLFSLQARGEAFGDVSRDSVWDRLGLERCRGRNRLDKEPEAVSDFNDVWEIVKVTIPVKERKIAKSGLNAGVKQKPPGQVKELGRNIIKIFDVNPAMESAERAEEAGPSTCAGSKKRAREASVEVTERPVSAARLVSKKRKKQDIGQLVAGLGQTVVDAVREALAK